MSCHKFDPKCRSCRPALLSFQPMSPQMREAIERAVDAVWDAAPYDEQAAFWRVTVKNARDEASMVLGQRLIAKIEEAVEVARRGNLQ